MDDTRSRRSTERPPAPASLLADGAAALSALLAQMPPGVATRRWCVAFSGGADSTALLRVAQHAAQAAGTGLSALHVQHGLHPDAEHWAMHCQTVAAALGVPLTIARVRVVATGQGLEAAARRARYQAFAEVDADVLLLAHHRNDQIETVLLNLLRGAGAHGASGIPAVRWLTRRDGALLPLLRPLLAFDRAALRHWASEAGHGWIEDPSNGDATYSRALLRTQVLPRLRARFPVDEALTHAAARLREAADLLDERADEDLGACAPGGRLHAAPLALLSPARQRNVLYRVLAKAGVRVPTATRLEELRRQFVRAGIAAQIRVSFGDHLARVWRQQLWIVPVTAPPAGPLPWSGEADVAWGAGQVVFRPVLGCGLSRARLMAGGATLRTRQGGERLRLAADRPRQRLKTLWQASATPPWQRDALPLLWAEGNLVWVPGWPADPTYAARPDEAGVEPAWQPVVA